jgi:hypothetical protein
MQTENLSTKSSNTEDIATSFLDMLKNFNSNQCTELKGLKNELEQFNKKYSIRDLRTMLETTKKNLTEGNKVKE